MKKKIIIIGISSDIGKALALKFYDDGYEIIGTYRTKKNINLLPKNKFKLIKFDIHGANRVSLKNLMKASKGWKVFISCTGTLNPIGKLFSQDIYKVKSNFNINFFSNLEILKEIFLLRKKNSHIFFFSGSGSNGPANDLSFYSLSKLLLIKISELISEEYRDLRSTTIGPGFINTKIHQELVAKKRKAATAYKKYLKLKKKKQKDEKSHDNLYNLIKTCIKNPEISNGRNFSSKYDDWQNNFKKYKLKIKKNNNFFKLRRYE